LKRFSAIKPKIMTAARRSAREPLALKATALKADWGIL